MKKGLIILAIAMFSTSAFSQFQIGPKFGMNFSKQKGHTTGSVSELLYGDFNDNVRSKMGTQFGFMMNMGGDHVFNFQPEFMYVNRGYKYVDSDGNLLYTQKNNYLDIDLLFNLGKTTNSTWRVYGILGPAIDVWLSQGAYDKDGEFIAHSDEFSFDDGNNSVVYTDVRVDVSFVFGAGFKYRLGPGWLIFSPRYKWGFVPQHSKQYLNSSDNDFFYLTNKGFYLDFGYAFQFGGEEK